MPIQTAKRTARHAGKRIATAAAAVRSHWSRQEADRRRELAVVMQHRLVEALRLVPARVDRPR